MSDWIQTCVSAMPNIWTALASIAALNCASTVVRWAAVKTKDAPAGTTLAALHWVLAKVLSILNFIIAKETKALHGERAFTPESTDQ